VKKSNLILLLAVFFDCKNNDKRINKNIKTQVFNFVVIKNDSQLNLNPNTNTLESLVPDSGA
jgi:hypothetical protein